MGAAAWGWEGAWFVEAHRGLGAGKCRVGWRESVICLCVPVCYVPLSFLKGTVRGAE